MFVFSMFGDVLNVRFMTRLLNVILIGILSYSCCAAAAPPLYVASKDGVEITISGVFHSSISEAGPPPNGLTDAVVTAGAIAVEFDVSSRFAGDRARDVMRQFRIKAVDLLRPDQIESAKDKIYGIMGRRDVAERMLSSPPCLLIEMLMACHEKVRHFAKLADRIAAHITEHGADPQAREAAKSVMRYFDIAAPLHHADED